MAENNNESNSNSTIEETQQPKRCFVIMPFSDPDGYAPGHFRKVYDQIIKPAVESAGYEAYRIDENGVSDLITTKIFKAILDCDMAICDLSSRNPNVLYELGIRHAFDKPVVLIKDNKTDRIFDIQGISTVEYRRERLYDEVIEDQKKISEAIKANENNSSGYSILNMVNLQKASYDASIKDPYSPEINNALLMRIVIALEKKEQKQDNFDKLFNNNLHSVDKSRTEKFQEEITQIKLDVIYLNHEVDNLDPSNATLEYVNKIENQIREIETKILLIYFNNAPAFRQSTLLDYVLNDIKSMLDKIQKIKRKY